jgi:L-asparaginase
MYETSSKLKKIGVTGGQDLSFESAVTKLMFVLGQNTNKQKRLKMLTTSLRGELSNP